MWLAITNPCSAGEQGESCVLVNYATLDEKLPEVTAALSAGLKLYCVNPDLIVVRQNGTKMLCAGVIGRYYEEQGGAVVFIGT